MTDAMTVNYLFFLGILIPCIITIVLFIVFIYCMRKFRIRREIMTKKHDPHGRLRKLHGAYAPPPPPLPPMWSRQSAQFKQKDRLLCERDNEAYDEAGEISQAQGGNHQLYQTCNDSGMSDLSEAQYRYDQERPYSQSSTDSEDSGFRSSRSGQYLHSAQNSNTQDMPLFKPIKSHRESLTMTVHQAVRPNSQPAVIAQIQTVTFVEVLVDSLSRNRVVLHPGGKFVILGPHPPYIRLHHQPVQSLILSP